MLSSCILIGLLTATATATPPPPPPSLETPVLKVVRDSHDSILREHRRYGVMLDFPESFAAVDITGWTAMETTASHPITGHNAFWRSPDSTAVAVDERLFSELTVVDIPSLQANIPTRIGRIVAVGAEPAAVARLLIQADVILTWIHIGSELTVISEVLTDDGGWQGTYAGTHVYFTNEENVDPLAFRVDIDSKGQIMVTAR